MIKYLYGIKVAVGVDLKDCVALAGLCLVGLGVGIIDWRAAPLVVAGVALVGLAVARVRRGNTR